MQDRPFDMDHLLTGYVVDRLVGNTKGLGGILGIFTALGVPVPWVFYNTLAWNVGVGINYAILGASSKLLYLLRHCSYQCC